MTVDSHQPTEKFSDPRATADGAIRATVSPTRLEMVWFNTGTLCNIECPHCYIESSPRNDRLDYLSVSDVQTYLDEIETHHLPVTEIGFTGGEPFVNPDFPTMLEVVLARGLRCLILTNAMCPMMRPHCREALHRLAERYTDKLEVRVSLDHYTRELHDSERGDGAWASALDGIHWLIANRVQISIAGRNRWNEEPAACRAGYRALFQREGIPCDADDPRQLVLFPEMDPSAEVPEITVDCWDIVGVKPAEIMCSRSRMVVRRKGAAAPVVIACTLLPYEADFEMGRTLSDSLRPIALNHPYCAGFCVLGGGSCSV